MPAHPGFASRLFASGSLAFVLIGLLGAAYGASLPAFTRNFGLEPGEAGLILSAQGAGAVIVVFAGTMGFRGLTARLSALLMVVGAGLIAAGVNWPLTLVGGAIAGAGFGITATHVNRAFLHGFGPRGPGMVGLVNAISAIGLIAGPLIYVGVGGSTGWLFGGIAMLAALTLFLYGPKEDSFSGSTSGLPDIGAGRLSIVALNMGGTMIESSMIGLGVVALIATGQAETTAQLLLSGFFVAFLISRLSLYWLSAWIAPERLFLIGTGGTAAAATLAALGLPGTGFVLAGGFIGLAFPAFYVWSARALGSDPRIGSSVLLAGLLGGALGPLLTGMVLRQIGLPMLFAAIACAAITLSLIAGWAMSRRAPPAIAGI